jgi:preprotein translocase subunit YajC
LAEAAPAPAPSPAPKAEAAPTTATTGTPTGVGGPPPPAPPAENPFGIFMMIGPMMLIFYFLFIRPENKRKKEKELQMASMKPKDKVVTIGGLYGTIVEIDGDEVVLLVDAKKDVKLRFRRTAVDVVEPTKS